MFTYKSKINLEFHEKKYSYLGNTKCFIIVEIELNLVCIQTSFHEIYAVLFITVQKYEINSFSFL